MTKGADPAADRYAHWAARSARGEILGARLIAASSIVLVLAGTSLTWPPSDAGRLAPQPPQPPVVRTSPPPTSSSGPAPPTTGAPPEQRPATQATAPATTVEPAGNLPEPAARPPASVVPAATAGPPATTTPPPAATRAPRNPAKGLPDADGIRICYRIADADILIQRPCTPTKR